MNELQIFNYDSKEVRTVLIDGVPYWVAKDVCEILKLVNVSMALDGLEEDEKGISKVDTLGGIQNLSIITESGLYSLVIRSNRPEARKFRKWITSEVIPSIRKTGHYGVKAPSNLIEALKLALEQAVQIEEMKPKALEHDLFMDNKNAQKIGGVAKSFGIPVQTFHQMLRDAKIIMADYQPYAGYEKYFKTVITPTKVGNVFTSYIYPSGISYIAKRFNLVEK